MEIIRTYEHNGKKLQLGKNELEAAGRTGSAFPSTAPGTGDFEIGPLSLSADRITAGEAVTLSAQVTGRKIAYIFSEILLQDKELNQAYGPLLREYVPAGRSKASRGLSRPDWEETIDLSLQLTPALRLISDGVESAFAFLTPEAYGGTDHWLEGNYASADGASKQRARITFGPDGETKKMVGFKEVRGRSAPHALTLQPNDSFTPFAQILTPPVEEGRPWQVKKGLSTPLTLRGQALRWQAEAPLPGDYLVGLVIQDLDGRLTRKYAPLTIR